MEQLKPTVQMEHFSICKDNEYLIFGTWPLDADAMAELNESSLEVSVSPWENLTSLDKMEYVPETKLYEAMVSVKLDKEIDASGKLVIFYVIKDVKTKWFEISGKDLLRKQHCPQFNIEQVIRDTKNKTCRIAGWCAAHSYVSIEAFDEEGNKMEGAMDRFVRTDLPSNFPECTLDPDAGFTLSFKNIKGKYFTLKFSSVEGESLYTVYMEEGKVRAEQIKTTFNKTIRFVKTKGITALPGKVLSHLKKTDRPIEYKDWLPYHLPDKAALEEQRKMRFDYEPKLSIVVPLYKTPENYLNMLVNSVKAQTYQNWELCLSDGSGENSEIGIFLSELTKSDKRIVVIPSDIQRRIVENTNRAIEAASGDFIIFADHDDELTPNALFEVALALNENKDLDVLYTDEDKTDENSSSFFEPHMKPEFNKDLLRTVNYICHMFVVRKTLLDRVGYLDAAFEGAQDYDLLLRCTESTDKIKRIPKVLYHWRCHSGSTSENPESKRYAFDAGRRAVKAHLDRLGIKAEVLDGEYPGLYRTKYLRGRDPLISILIPNKDHIDDLKRVMKSIDEKSTYRNFEYVIIENNSEKEETFEYYKELTDSRSDVNVVYYDGGFNFSLINNFGEQYAKGEYLLFLNNDIEMIADDTLEDMLGFCMRSDVGAVGARLYYEDDTVQHAGVVVGFGGIAGHCFVQQPRWSTGYMHRIICAQDYSAVTAACMLVDRDVFKKIGGFTEELAVAFNDIDLCMKITKSGYLVVYDPYAILYHYESKSRGLEDTPEKKARFQKEIAIFKERWPDIFEKGDPYYNPNLTLKSQDFSLKRLH